MKIRTAILTIGAVMAVSAYRSGRVDMEKLYQLKDMISDVVLTHKEVYDYAKLNNDKIGYGQGVRVDEQNKPYGAIEFNAQYGKYNAIAINDTGEKTIMLTFDQGYENGYTAKILDTLKEKNVKATFFVIGDYAERNHELVQRMIDEGHRVGNHSMSHYSMPTLSSKECIDEITDLHQYMLDVYKYEMTDFRPPMGEFSEMSLAVTEDCKYRTVLWSFAYADWDVNKQPDANQAKEKLINAAHDGAIYLLHSVSATNAQILGDFIDEMINRGYSFV